MRIGCVGMGSIDTALLSSGAVYDHDAVTVVDQVVVSLGGKGLIAAIALQHEGVEVAPLALVGGNSRIATMMPGGLERDWLVPALAEDSRIWLSVSGGEHVTAWVAVGRSTRDDAEFERVATRYVDSVDALYLSFEALPLLRAALGAAVSRRIPIAVNLSRPLIDALARDDPMLLREMVARAALVLCNADEGQRVHRELSARNWSDITAPDVELVVTEGAQGGAVSSGSSGSWTRYEAVPVRVCSVVGAGDTFSGAYLAARWARALPPDESCRRAAALAARCVTGPTSSILP